MWVVIILITDHCLSITLEYGSSVWDTKSILLQDELDKVQKRATRFETGNYAYETGIDGWIDGWRYFTSFSTVFQSYQDDGVLKMKGCVQTSSVYG